MGKQLIITEKPSVARDIAAALDGFQEGKGDYLENDTYVITWAVGHLLELAEPQDYDKKLSSWSVKNLPIIPEEFQIKPREGQKKRLELIRKLARRKDIEGAVNACDAGREGEMIYRRIAEYTNLSKLPQRRLWLQSMTRDAIRKAFAELRPGSELDRLSDAAWCRAVGDWLIGMNATRALTQRLKSRGQREAWSAGRVQTPTLNLLVQRERRILAHVPRPYWELVGRFAHGEQEWEARYWDPQAKAPKDEEDGDPDAKPSRIFDGQRVQRILDALATRPQGDVSEKRKKSRQKPPLPFDLTSLQREANKRYAFSARRTLDAAQRLYEGHKLVTYPRTDSRYLPDDFGPTLETVLRAFRSLDAVGPIASDILEVGMQNLERVLDGKKVSDHFAIVPTGTLPKGELSGDDSRIFDLVVRQFMAALMGPATWSTVERIVHVPIDDEVVRFRVTGRTLEEPGFHRALGTRATASTLLPLVPGKNEVTGLPAKVLEVHEEEKETRPPPHYSEAQLLRMMETAGELMDDDELSEALSGRGLGTPATRAETMEGLVRKGYARRVEGKLAATSKAMRLMDVLERVHAGPLASPKLTGEWEHKLQQVQSGRIDRSEMLAQLTDFTREVVDTLVTFEHDALYEGEPDLGVCPACKQGRVWETVWGYRCSRNTGKESPCDLMIWKDRAGRYIDRATARRLVEHGKAGPLTGFVDPRGRMLEGTVHLERDPEKERWTLRVEYGQGSEEEGEEEVTGELTACPAHEGCVILETQRRYVCRQLFEGKVAKGPQLPKLVCHREMNPDEARVYFGEEGKTPFLEGFISRRGRPFTGAIFRKETGRHGFEFPPRAPKAKKGKAADDAKAPAKGAKKATAKKATAKKATAKKATAKKTTAKKATTKKATTKKAPRTAAKGKTSEEARA